MRVLTTLGGLLVLGAVLAGPALAADLVLDEPAPIAAPSDWARFYIEVYGGLALAGTASIDVEYSSPWEADLEGGLAFGASIGLMTPIDGLSIELDAMMADGGEYVDYVPEGQATSSLMIAAEYAVALGDTFAIYGTAGVGMINSVYTDLSGETTFDATGAGYQLAVGARAKVTEGIAVFGEVKYQNSFEPIGISDGIYTYDVQYPNVTVLSGLRFEF